MAGIISISPTKHGERSRSTAAGGGLSPSPDPLPANRQLKTPAAARARRHNRRAAIVLERQVRYGLRAGRRLDARRPARSRPVSHPRGDRRARVGEVVLLRDDQGSARSLEGVVARATTRGSRHLHRRRQWPRARRASARGAYASARMPGRRTRTADPSAAHLYYVSQSVLKRGAYACQIGRVPAGDTENAVVDQLRTIFRQPEIVVGTWREMRGHDAVVTEAEVREALRSLDPL